MQIQEQVELAPLTTFNIGGPARFFTSVSSVEELKESLDFAQNKHLTVFTLGGGSNTLVPDEGLDAVVIKLELKGVRQERETVIAEAGEAWDTLVAYAVSRGLWGIENLSGIPGSVGGAVVQGIGAYGAAIGETLVWVEVLDSETGDIQRMSNTECLFGYRDSFFKHDGGRHIVLRGAFRLSAKAIPNLSYQDVARAMSGKTPTLSALREAVLEIRKGKFPDLALEGTAGSFFKNPIVSAQEAEILRQKYPGMPLFPMPETSGIKVPLAWLLDRVLQLKGFGIHGARLYEKQPLVIVTQKNTSSRDVLELASIVEEKVKKEFNIALEREVRVLPSQPVIHS